jgi:predicted nuclease of predicted toxin-antitoxin system
MKLLLDECVTHDLKRDLTGHEISTVVEAGFGGLENGELLRAASDKYEVLITVDRNLRHQQRVRDLQIAVMVIEAVGIRYNDLKPLIPKALEALATIKPGDIVLIS